MTEPLTPRLELLRLVLLAMQGAPAATLDAIVTLLTTAEANDETALARLQSIIDGLAAGPISLAGPGEPTAGVRYAYATWKELTDLVNQYDAATASQLQADNAAIARLPLLTDIDIKFGNLGLFLGTTLDVPNRSDPLGATIGDIANAVETLVTGQAAIASALVQLGTLQATANGILADLLLCCQEGSTGGEPQLAQPPCIEGTALRAETIFPLGRHTYGGTLYDTYTFHFPATTGMHLYTYADPSNSRRKYKPEFFGVWPVMLGYNMTAFGSPVIIGVASPTFTIQGGPFPSLDTQVTDVLASSNLIQCHAENGNNFTEDPSFGIGDEAIEWLLLMPVGVEPPAAHNFWLAQEAVPS